MLPGLISRDDHIFMYRQQDGDGFVSPQLGYLETRNMCQIFGLRHGQILVILGLNCDLQNMLLTTIVKQCVGEEG